MVSEAVARIVSYFVTVTLATATVKALEEADMTLDDLLSSYETTDNMKIFIDAMAAVCEGAIRADFMRMYNYLHDAKSGAPKRGAPANLVEAVVAAAGVEGSSAESINAAAQAHLNESEGKWPVLKLCMLYGVEMLRLAATDADTGKKLKAAKLAKGGEWTSHLATRIDWDKFIHEVIEYLMDADGGNNAAVVRLQKFQLNVPAWHQGGKVYVRAYLKKHSCNFPEEVDVVLLIRSQAEAKEVFESQLGKLSEANLDMVSGSMDRIKALEKEVTKLRTIDGGGLGGAQNRPPNGRTTAPYVPYNQRRCLKCCRIGHIANECNTPAAQAEILKKEYYDSLSKDGVNDGVSPGAAGDGN